MTAARAAPGPVETTGPAPPEAHRRRGAERDAEDMLERRPVAVPADPGAGIVADQQGLDESPVAGGR